MRQPQGEFSVAEIIK